MEKTIMIDGREVRLRASAAIPRLYRIKFRRDILQDMQTIKKAVEKSVQPLFHRCGNCRVRVLCHQVCHVFKQLQSLHWDAGHLYGFLGLFLVFLLILPRRLLNSLLDGLHIL